MSNKQLGPRAAALLAAILAAGFVATPAAAQVPSGWQGSGMGPLGYTVGYDVSRQSGGRQASGLEERSGYIGANVDSPVGGASLTQAINADEYRGQRVRLSGYIRKTSVAGNSAELFLRVEGNGLKLAADYRSAATSQMTSSSDWVRRELIVDIPRTSTGLRFGLLKDGAGEAWLRSVKLEVVGSGVAHAGFVMIPGAAIGTVREIAGNVARQEAVYRRLPRHPVNLDFMGVSPR